MISVGNTILYSTEDLIDKFHISKGTALKFFKSPYIHTVEIGKYTYICESELEKALSKGIRI